MPIPIKRYVYISVAASNLKYAMNVPCALYLQEGLVQMLFSTSHPEGHSHTPLFVLHVVPVRLEQSAAPVHEQGWFGTEQTGPTI